MEPRPIRMPEELWQAIQEDAEEKNRMAAEHVRQICREYLEADKQHVHERLEVLEKRVDRLEDECLPAKGGARGETEAGTAAGTEAEHSPEAGAQRGAEAPRERTARDTPESGTAEAGLLQQIPEDVEPVEEIDDVLAKAAQEFGERHDPETVERILAAGKAALEELRSDGELTADDFRDRLADEYPVPGQDEEVWWHESVEPILEIAQDWGLVISSHGYKYEWIGKPS